VFVDTWIAHNAREASMGRVRRKRDTAEFKAEAVRLVQTSDQRVTEIAEQLGVTAKTLHEWVRARARRRDDVSLDRRGEGQLSGTPVMSHVARVAEWV
jgi:transposase-like protein